MGIFFVSVCVSRARVLGRVRRRGDAWIESDARDPRRYGGRARTTDARRAAVLVLVWFALVVLGLYKICVQTVGLCICIDGWDCRARCALNECERID